MSSLTCIRRSKDSTFTTINNAVLRDVRISLKAKGLIMVVMGLPPEWNFSIGGMAAILKEGTDAIYAAVDELIEHGYAEREQHRDENGRVAGTTYTFHETPRRETPYRENPDVDNPDVDNPLQYKKDLINETKNIPTEAKSTLPPRVASTRWNDIVACFVCHGNSDKQARSMLGKLCKDFDATTIEQCFTRFKSQIEGSANAFPYFKTLLKTFKVEADRDKEILKWKRYHEAVYQGEVKFRPELYIRQA